MESWKMDGDLDELLDEVETKFCRNVSLGSQTDPCPSRSSNQAAEGIVRKHRETTHTNTENVDDFLKDLLDTEVEDCDFYCDTKVGQLSSEAKMTSKAKCELERKICCPVFLGGSSIVKGVGTAISQRSCDQLRCTSCDFRVVMFEDYDWDPSCDYLFFRNNMPDCQKLQSKLKRRKGMRAYACQCSWHTAQGLIDLRDQNQLKPMFNVARLRTQELEN